MNRRQSSRVIVSIVILALALVGYLIDNSQNRATVPRTSAPGTTAGGSWYQIYFTDPKYPDNAADHHGGLDARLVTLMDSAQKTLDVADYDFDLQDVAQAMARAKKRGVQVRMVTDTDTLTNKKNEPVQAAFKVLKAAGIPIVDDQREAIMHDKYTIVDGEWVETGGWNYTEGDTYHLNNWMGIFHSKQLAANYSADFDQMFAHKFGAEDKKKVPHRQLTIDGDSVQNCFSPQGNCRDLIISAINQDAKHSINFMAFSFTDDGIGKAMRDKAKAGVAVQGVFETTGSHTPYSEYGKMKKAGLAVYTDGNPWVMHHKVIIIDDRWVIAGSFNFSQNADKDNDENLLIVDDPTMAKQFTAEFDRVLAQAKNPVEK